MPYLPKKIKPENKTKQYKQTNKKKTTENKTKMKKSGKTRKQKETHPQTYQTKRKTHLKATLKYAGAFLYFAETAVQPLLVQTSCTKPPPILLANQQKKT